MKYTVWQLGIMELTTMLYTQWQLRPHFVLVGLSEMKSFKI